MTDLPLSLRRELAAAFVPLGSEIARHQESADGTHKLLLRLHDGQLVECVLIQENDRRTACISTQVGCGMGCVFCASGLDGVARNLTSGEILEQLVQAPQSAAGAGTVDPHRRHGHGRAAGQPRQPHRGPRRRRRTKMAWASAPATSPSRPSACRQKMRRLADLGKQYHLAVSLHAPNDELRDADRADQRQDRPGGHPRGGGLFLREDRPAGDLRIRAAARSERSLRSTRPSWPACSAAGRRTST